VRWTNVDAKPAPHTKAEAEWVAAQRKWTRGWRRLVLLAIPLVYLIYVAGSVRQNSHGAAAVAGYAVLAAFAACWLAVPLVPAAEASKRRFWAWDAVLAAPAGAGVPVARAAGVVVVGVIAAGAGCPRRADRGRSGPRGAAGPGRDRALARQPGRRVRHRHTGRDPGRRAHDVRGIAGGAREQGARRGPRRAVPARRGERADPDRPRPARPARPLADHDHGEGR